MKVETDKDNLHLKPKAIISDKSLKFIHKKKHLKRCFL